MSPGIKILVVNVHSALNAGDLALLQTTIDLLRQVFKDATFLVSSNFPDEPAVRKLAERVVASPWKLAGGGTPRKTRYLVLNLILGWISAITGYYRLAFVPGKAWKTLFEAYQEADLVVAVSGNQFFSSGRFGWPLLAIAMSVELAAVFKKPAYIMPQSIGPLRTWWERQLLYGSYAPARKIYIRDLQSMHLAQFIHLPADRVQFVPDPAFTLQPASVDEARVILQRYGYRPDMPAIGVTVIASMPSYLDPDKIDNYYDSVADALSELIKKHKVHVFFFYQVSGPSPHEDDRIATDEVIERMSVDKSSVHLVKEILSPAQLKACYGCMDAFLASRLHSGIFSLSMGVPTVFVGYLTKTRGVLEALGLQQNLLELDNLTKNSLSLQVESLWSGRDQQKAALTGKTDEIVCQIQQAVQSIYEDYYQQYD